MADSILTPSKITAWLDCSWYLTLQNGEHGASRNQPGALADLLMQKGLDHEDTCLREFEEQGLSVFRAPERHEDESFEQWVARVGDPMADGWDVIYQFPMVHDGMRGIADFLVRVPTPVDGFAGYEPYDAKLTRTEAKPGHVLQLCFYADALQALTGAPPRQVHLWLGSGRVESLTVEQLGPFWRRLRQQLRAVMAAPVDAEAARAVPCSHCEFCEYSQHCEHGWRASDSLVFVAGMRNREIDACDANGVGTLAALSIAEQPIPGIRVARQERLRQQSALQVVSRADPDRPPAFEPVPVGDDSVWGHGYAHLPLPDAGDVYFDLEGHPFWTPAAGLFFLFGLWYLDQGEWVYEARWAHDLDEQARAAADVLAFFDQRRSEHPDCHVYHYNHTERSGMATMTLGTPSEALFAHLRMTGLFVDLMTVATNSFLVGVESYGLKSLEALTGFERQEGIGEGVGAVIDYETYLQGGDPALLDAIARYNRDDVMATRALHQWLLDHRPPDDDWRAPILDEFEVDPELDLLAEQLLESDLGTVEHLLGDLLGYWRRERSADVGPKFAQLQGEVHELLDDPDVLAGLTFVGFEEHQGRSGDLKYAIFSWPDQELDNEVRKGSTALIAGGLDESGFAGLVNIDRQARTVTLRWNEKREEDGFFPRALRVDDWVQPKPKPEVLCQLARQVLAIPAEGAPNPVSVALLRRALPTFVPGRGPAGGEFTDDLAHILGWANDLDASYVAIQGPPGTGKTYRGAHIIHGLVTSGKRVGISAMGHAAIDNLLKATHEVFVQKGELDRLVACKKSKKPDGGGLAGVAYPSSNAAAANAKFNLVAGTSWFFSSREMRDAPVDVLIVDEAGQLSLADAVAASGAARNVLLLGDPLQLAQVSKGTHPDGSGASVLEHVLGEDATITPDRGVFLAETRRMHPAVCDFISSQFYEGRLSSYPACSDQGIDGVAPGLVWLEGTHAGRTTESPEEAEIVVAAILDLIGRDRCDRHGSHAPLEASDFMVVAPYNDQVHRVREALCADPRTSAVQVGTVDKFQGREASVVFFTMTTSNGDEIPRGPDFLFSRNRLNVAISRAQCLAVLVCTEDLLNSRARTVEDMHLIGTLSAFVESARTAIA